MTLKDVKIGQSARVLQVGGHGALRQHLLDMGLIPGTTATVVKYAPMGDPVEISVHGYALTLRLEDAAQIAVALEPDAPAAAPTAPASHPAHEADHPGLGEGGRYHDKTHEQPLPEGAQMSFALVGNQNCGKTTLFNQLTGSNQHVGNFPGVTVEQKSGPMRGAADTTVTDLPGIYSLSPYSAEERVSRRFIIDERPQGIINIVDATNIERNLYLTLQLMELGRPMVLALNMMDEVENNHGTIRVNTMERLLGLPVVPISAKRGEGIAELVGHVVHVARYQEAPARQDFCDKDDHGGAVHRCLHAVMHLIEDHAQRSGIPQRFAATKLIEGEAEMADALALSQNERETVEHLVLQMEEERGLDRAAAIADMRFAFIRRVTEATVVRPQVSKERLRSDRADRILTGRWTGLPVFFALMALVFWLTFFVVGAPLQAWLDAGVGAFSEWVDGRFEAWGVNGIVRSLVVDGILSGVGTVVTFLPLIVTLFFFLSLLEDSGYMARVAFVMDSLLRRIGLSGRSIVPMLIGFGCSVPAVMSTRTLPSERDRRLTVMLIPFMSCTAKLPIYAFFCAVFFPHSAWLVMTGLYLLGIAVGIVFALCFKSTFFRGEPVPFVMELPNYRMPSVRSVARLLWDKGRDFLERAFTVIFLASMVIWFLQTFDFHLNAVSDEADSILATVAGYIAPVFRPMGFGDWRITTALATGFMAKESVVSTVGQLFGSPEALVAVLTPAATLALLVFCLLYTPCIAAVAAIRRELGTASMLLVVVLQCVVAWLCAFAAFWVAEGLSI